MKRFTILFVLLIVMTFTASAFALDVGKDVKLDGHVKLGYVWEGADSSRVDANTRTFRADVNTDYHLDMEAGVTYKGIARLYASHDALENINNTSRIGLEGFLTGLLDNSPINAGLYVEYGEHDDLRMQQDSEFYMTGIVIRLP